MYAGQVVKIECLKVKFDCLKVKFEWLKGQRNVQHPEDIQVNECTPRECTSACKARGFWLDLGGLRQPDQHEACMHAVGAMAYVMLWSL